MKKRILTVLIAIITVIPLVLISPKADVQTSTHTVTSYGDYTFQQGMSTTTFNYELPGFPINLTWNSGSYMKLDYNFKDKYSGSMKLTVTSNQDWVLNSSPVYWSVSGDGVEAVCYISSTTTMSTVGKTKTFSIIFYNCTGIHFEVATGSSATFFTSSNSITISNATFTTQADLNDIYLDMRNFHNSWDLYIPDMSTNLSNIASNTSTIASDIAILKNYLDGVEGGLDLLNQTLYDLRVPIDSIYLNWNTAVSGATTGYVSNSSDPNLYIYKTDLGGITISRTDARFSSYDVINGNYIILKWFFDLNGTGTANQYYDFNNIRFQWRDPAGNLNNLNIFTGDSLSFAKFVEYNTTRNSYILTIYCPASCFIGSNSSVTFYDFAVDQFTLNDVQGIGFMFGGMSDTLPYDSQYLSLLESINNGIGGSSYDTSQYEQYEQTIDSLNDNMRDRFDNSTTSFQNNINNILTPDQTSGGSNTIFQQFHFDAISNVFSGFLSDIFEIAPAIKYILLFGLLLLVLGVLI